MDYILKGKLLKKFDTVEITDTFKKREFIVEQVTTIKDKQFEDPIKFQVTGERCQIFDGINEGDEISVHFNLRGREWVKEDRSGYFVNLESWKIDTVNDTVSDTVKEEPVAHDDLGKAPEPSDDLPF